VLPQHQNKKALHLAIKAIRQLMVAGSIYRPLRLAVVGMSFIGVGKFGFVPIFLGRRIL
jgi:hypothetical protein